SPWGRHTSAPLRQNAHLQRNVCRAAPRLAGWPLEFASMRIRMFGHYWQLGLVLLWVLESTVIFGCCVLAFRWFGGADAGILWFQASVLAGCVMVAAIAMGLFS